MIIYQDKIPFIRQLHKLNPIIVSFDHGVIKRNLSFYYYFLCTTVQWKYKNSVGRQQQEKIKSMFV